MAVKTATRTMAPMPSQTSGRRPNRLPVAVSGTTIVADGSTQSFVAGDSTSLLRNYLTLVRSMRQQKRAPEIVLRRDDIEVLAAFLDEPEETVLDRLAALMGATRTQRTALLSLFASGALLIGLASSTAAASPAGTGSPSSVVPPETSVVVAAEVDGDIGAPVITVVPASQPAAPAATLDTTVTAATSVATDEPPAPELVPAPVATTAVVSESPSIQPTAPLATTPTAPRSSTPAPDVPTPTAAPVVQVAEPPVPDEVTDVTTTVPVDPSTVDVGLPPVVTNPTGEPPLDVPTTTTVDPSTVEVGLPPVPTTTVTSATTSG